MINVISSNINKNFLIQKYFFKCFVSYKQINTKLQGNQITLKGCVIRVSLTRNTLLVGDVCYDMPPSDLFLLSLQAFAIVLFISSSPSSYICFIMSMRDSLGSFFSSNLGFLQTPKTQN